jgi:predicted amidophosphoribosyltransferase
MSWIYEKWGDLLKAAGAFLRDTVYPEGAVCTGCGKISDGRPLCPDCRKQLAEDGASFAWSFTEPEPGLPAYSLRPHEGLSRTLVLKLKHQGEACLAKEMAETVLPLPAWLSFSPETVVTWVPMPKARLRVRGIDHGRLLAEAVAKQLSLPCRQLLNRTNDRSRAQAALDRAGREQNLTGVFTPVGRIRVPVLLVDDVLTTGTTARRCAEALRKGGAKDITVLTFTRAVGTNRI